MIRTIRAFFLSRLLREKVLLAGFIVLAAAVWVSSIAGRTGRTIRAVRATSGSLNEQRLWLSNRAMIEASAQAAASRLDPVRTLDATRLLAEVNAIAGDVGLQHYTSGESKNDSSGHFSVHTLQFSVTGVDWATLKQFYLALSKRSPYIGIEQCSMQTDRAKPTLLNVSFQISSVEISRNG
jgi:hypothetical protein